MTQAGFVPPSMSMVMTMVVCNPPFTSEMAVSSAPARMRALHAALYDL